MSIMSSSCLYSRSIAVVLLFCSLFFFNDPATTEIYTLSLHDALPISLHSAYSGSHASSCSTGMPGLQAGKLIPRRPRSEEHTSELQSRFDLVCRLLLEKKKKN